MNKVKRNLEIAAAIISIISASIMSLIIILAILALLGLLEGVTVDKTGIFFGENTETILMIMLFIFLGIFITIIVLGSILCKTPIKYGVIQNRLGISITLLVLLGLMALNYISNGFIFILLSTAFGLLLASTILKHNNILLHDDSYFEDRNFNKEDTKLDNIDNLENKLTELKRLKDSGLIDENQYKESVDKLLK